MFAREKFKEDPLWRSNSLFVGMQPLVRLANGLVECRHSFPAACKLFSPPRYDNQFQRCCSLTDWENATSAAVTALETGVVRANQLEATALVLL